MSKGKPSKPNVFWVNVELNKDQMAMARQWFSNQELSSLLLKVSEDGIKLSMKYDTYNKCHQVTLTHDEYVVDGLPVVLTGRGSEPLKALERALWFHCVYSDGNWHEVTKTTFEKDPDF